METAQNVATKCCSATGPVMDTAVWFEPALGTLTNISRSRRQCSTENGTARENDMKLFVSSVTPQSTEKPTIPTHIDAQNITDNSATAGLKACLFNFSLRPSKANIATRNTHWYRRRKTVTRAEKMKKVLNPGKSVTLLTPYVTASATAVQVMGTPVSRRVRPRRSGTAAVSSVRHHDVARLTAKWGCLLVDSYTIVLPHLLRLPAVLKEI
uniref:Uncharacterized protein n=1 Tax=Branchiostoma floridae TaxID=7739 RepID=C3YZX3_BRAFL|eukprot:XP_002598382.1 hypothetical protein BRAFLDRAFT_96865 [Branchiostoma floridae]